MGRRWIGVARAAPIRSLVAGVAALVLLALPVTHLAMALPSDATAAEGSPQRAAAEMIEEGFGAGRNAPLLMVIDARGADATTAFASVVGWASEVPGLVGAQILAVNDAGDGAHVLITPSGGPNDDSTKALLFELRDGTADIESETGTRIGVTGIVAVQTDVTDRLMSALPIYLFIVVGLAFVLLTVVFGSIVVPVTAAAGFLLSVGATFGVTVLLFQDGLFGLFTAAPLASSMPIFLIGIVFGLAMDYHVFLVSRMKESYLHGADVTTAVVEGFSHGARVVTAAALIMVSVFAAFVAQDDLFIQSMGFALATAVFLDAFVVRMTIIPAAMFLLGRRAWWLPQPLAKVLPHIDIDGESLNTDARSGAQRVEQTNQDVELDSGSRV
ncbi:MMPL family transporter [Rhodococcus fascians]|nr:MMPL family transporter [Rhodococcus fascians]MBY4114656.1 MMPL family transporter [Rhodococcus fascians]